eukprot:1139990-Pelagomonas_calceolata.AAC.1
MGATLVQRLYDLPATKFRLKELQQAEKEERYSNEKESKMMAERLEFQTYNSKQSRVSTVSLPTKESHAQQLPAEHK